MMEELGLEDPRTFQERPMDMGKVQRICGSRYQRYQ